MRTPLTDLEKSIVAKLSTASFPPATASKRFAQNLGDGYVRELSDKGRKFLAFVVHRYRRQYQLSQDEQQWVNEWLSKEIVSDSKPVCETASRSTDREGQVAGEVSEPCRQQTLFGNRRG